VPGQNYVREHLGSKRVGKDANAWTGMCRFTANETGMGPSKEYHKTDLVATRDKALRSATRRRIGFELVRNLAYW
jgi:hypothetical protein